MNTPRAFPTCIACAMAIGAIVVACTEPQRTSAIAPVEPAELRLILEPARGVGNDTVRVVLTASGFGALPVGSYTVRLQYDSSALRFVGELTTSNHATRASNAHGGTLRAAGIAMKGFTDGRLAVFEFVRVGSLQNPTAGSLPVLPVVTLEVLELHRLDRSDASIDLHVRDTRHGSMLR